MNREEKIAELVYQTASKKVASKKVASKWTTVKAMRMDLSLMLDQVEEWMEKEIEAVEEGTAGFDFRPYYRSAFDAIEEAEEQVRKIENRV